MTTIITNTQPAQRPAGNDTFLKAFAVLGAIAVFLAALWLIVQGVRIIPAAVSNLASALVSITQTRERIVVSAPTTVKNGEAVTISWTHEGKPAEGSYTFTYFCADNIAMSSPDRRGESVEVFCNTPFNFTNANDSITVTPFLTQGERQDVTVLISYRENGGSKTTEGRTTFALVASATPSAPGVPTVPTKKPIVRTPPTPTTGTPVTTVRPIPTPSNPTTANPGTSADLQVRILETGYVIGGTNTFVASSSVSMSDRAAVRFVVENVGGTPTGQWRFTAELPTIYYYRYDSVEQESLAPGDRIEYILGFDTIENRAQVQAMIIVDPEQRTSDTNRANNMIRPVFRVY